MALGGGDSGDAVSEFLFPVCAGRQFGDDRSGRTLRRCHGRYGAAGDGAFLSGASACWAEGSAVVDGVGGGFGWEDSCVRGSLVLRAIPVALDCEDGVAA